MTILRSNFLSSLIQILLAGALAASALAQKVNPSGAWRDELVRRYTRAANDADRDVQPGHPKGAAVHAWAVAYALRPEPFLLAELALALAQRGDSGDAWLLYSRFLGLRPNTPMRETIESRMRELAANTNPLLRSAPGWHLRRAGELRKLGEAAQQQGQLGPAQRDYGTAYALIGPAANLLADLARSFATQHKWEEAYVLWERVAAELLPGVNPEYEQELTTDPPAGTAELFPLALPLQEALRLEARQHLAALTYLPRPSYYPYLDLQAGAALAGRQLSFDGAGSSDGKRCFALQDAPLALYGTAACPALRLPMTAGLQAGVRLFPLAALPHPAARGLGLSVRVRALPAAELCLKRDLQGGCPGGTARAEQVRIEAGIVWDYNVRDHQRSPHLQVRAEYGYDDLLVTDSIPGQRSQSQTRLTYQYVALGVGTLAPVLARGSFLWSVGLAAQLNLLFAGGAPTLAAAAGGYGPARGGTGLRLEAMLARLQLRRGFYVQLDAQFDVLGVTLESSTPSAGQLPAAQTLNQIFFARGLRDLTYGSRLSLGYGR